MGVGGRERERERKRKRKRKGGGIRSHTCTKHDTLAVVDGRFVNWPEKCMLWIMKDVVHVPDAVVRSVQCRQCDGVLCCVCWYAIHSDK